MRTMFTGWRTPASPPAPRDHEARSMGAELDRRLDRALLTMEAMWSLLSEKLGVTDDELAERVVQLDLSDGTIDGAVRRPPLACPECDRTITRRFPQCLYCGTKIIHDPFA